MQHRYQVGQMLELRAASHYGNRFGGTCQVISCLPHDKGPVLYRIQADGERNERVVEETDLSPSSAPKPSSSIGETAFAGIRVGRR